jgi:hypothetical protein
MSAQVREALVASPRTVFQTELAMHRDLLDPTDGGTRTELIALLAHLVFDKQWAIEFTAIRTGHHDDTGLNPTPPHAGTHAAGWAVDCWPLASTTPGDYLDAGDERFRAFLRDVAQAPYHMQTGLVGDGADSAENFAAAGPTAFQDDGSPHVHIGAQPSVAT